MICNIPSCKITDPHLHFPKISELPKEVRTGPSWTKRWNDSDERKGMPLATGLLDYFPAALAEVAHLSKTGNDKHNPGEPLHHARGKSQDHADTILRHMAERGTKDTDGHWHDTKVAWRALAQLQELLEKEEGAPLPRAARMPTEHDG
jgi:hypothetical protein